MLKGVQMAAEDGGKGIGLGTMSSTQYCRDTYFGMTTNMNVQILCKWFEACLYVAAITHY